MNDRTPPRTSDDGALEQVRIRIAWLYYIEGLTQERIGRVLGLPRSRVNRLLGECRERGIVKFQIGSKLARAVELERALMRQFGLANAVVAPRPARQEDVPQLVGTAAAQSLPDWLKPGQSIGIGWGKTMHATSQALALGATPGLKIVSMFGGLPRSATINPYDIASRAAGLLRAECYFLNAPMVGSTEAATRALRDHHLLRESFRRMLSVDFAMFSVGYLGPGSTNLELGILTRSMHRSLVAAGAVGDIFGYYVDADGRALSHPANRLIVMPPLEQLLRIRRLILVSGGTAKVPVLRAALRLGRVDTLVTDESAAELLVSTPPSKPRHR